MRHKMRPQTQPARILVPDRPPTHGGINGLGSSAGTRCRHGLARCATTSAFFYAAAVADRNAPIAVLIPIIAEQFSGMLCTAGAVSTSQGVLWAIFVAPPANPFGVLWMQGECFRHREYFTGCQDEAVLWPSILLNYSKRDLISVKKRFFFHKTLNRTLCAPARNSPPRATRSVCAKSPQRAKPR